MQTLVMFLLYFAPTPGASGIGEVLSAAVMSTYVPRELTPLYILIWRLTLTLLHARRSGSSSSPAGCARGSRRSTEARWRSRQVARHGDAKTRTSPPRATTPRCSGAWCATSGPTAGWRPAPSLLLLPAVGPRARRARGSPSRRSTSPFPRQESACSASSPRSTGSPAAASSWWSTAALLLTTCDRPAGDVRPADADLRAPPAAQHHLLRPEPRRAADDAGHLRRRDAERAVLLGRGDDLRGRVHPRSPSWS